MLGWLIIIYPEFVRSSDKAEHTIAKWETQLEGTRWLDQLAKLGLVKQTERNGGYPMKYVGFGKDVLPLITDALESGNDADFVSHFLHRNVMDAFTFSVQNHKPNGPLKVNRELLNESLEDNNRITIECWDLS